MDVCKVCERVFKRRLQMNKCRGFFRRSLTCKLRNSQMTVFDAVKKLFDYQVDLNCYIVEIIAAAFV